MTHKQVTIDLDNPSGQNRQASRRSHQRQNLERVPIPQPPQGWRRRLPSAAALRAVLVATDGYVRGNEGWRVKACTIAEKIGYKDRGTVSRCLAWLVELGYITQVRTGRSNLISIEHEVIAAAIDAPPSEPAPPSDEGGAPNRCGRRPQQMRAAPPSTLPDTLTGISTATPKSEDWSVAAVQFCQLGMNAATAHDLVTRLNGRIPVAAAIDLLEYWQSTAHDGIQAWGLGALVQRLRAAELAGGLSIDEGWPPKSEAYQRAQSQAARDRHRMDVATVVKTANQAAVKDREQIQALESQYGPVLESMAEGDRDALAESVFTDSFSVARYRKTWRQPGTTARISLLERLAGR